MVAFQHPAMEAAIAFGLSGAFFLALRDIFGRPALQGINPVWGTAATALVGEVILAVASVLNGDFEGPLPRGGMALFNIAVAGILRITVARTLLFTAIKHIGASRASSLAAANVFFAMFLATLFLGESLTVPFFLGAVLIALGCVLITRSYGE